MKKHYLIRSLIMLACMIMVTTVSFADNPNTDVPEGLDGEYTFSMEGEKYGYESFMNSDHDNFIGARLYDVTIPDEGSLILEVSSSEITHMTLMAYSYEREKRVFEKDLVADDGVKGTEQTPVLPAGKYHVTFMYTFIPSSSLRYDEPGEKYFKHYISWKKGSYIRTSSVTVTPASETLETGHTSRLKAEIAPAEAYYQEVVWTSSAPGIVSVDEYGALTAKSAGTAVITASTKDGSAGTCTVTVTEPKPEPEPDNSGSTDWQYYEDDTSSDAEEVNHYIPQAGVYKVGGNKYEMYSTAPDSVVFVKAKNKKSVTVPATVTIGGRKYKVTEISGKAFTGSKIRTVTIGKNVKVIRKNAFKGSKATKLIVKTKLLKKAKVKGSLKSSKVKKIQVKVSSKKSTNKKYVKSYKKIFTKSNAGKKASVK